MAWARAWPGGQRWGHGHPRPHLASAHRRARTRVVYLRVFDSDHFVSGGTPDAVFTRGNTGISEWICKRACAECVEVGDSIGSFFASCQATGRAVDHCGGQCAGKDVDHAFSTAYNFEFYAFDFVSDWRSRKEQSFPWQVAGSECLGFSGSAARWFDYAFCVFEFCDFVDASPATGWIGDCPFVFDCTRERLSRTSEV